MVRGIYDNEFALTFSKKLEKAGVSCYQMHNYSHLDQAYLSRLKKGLRKNPSLSTLIRISIALANSSDDIDLYDIEEHFNSVGRSIFTKQ